MGFTTKEGLNEREREILRHVVYNYIQTAIPVGSRYISKKFESHLSPATIRNVMADLEESGYLSHPHTSAGRVPTDIGYRYYIDFLMDVEQLSQQDKLEIQNQLGGTTEPETLLRETSKLLGKISKQLSIVSSPHISSGIFEKLELIPISSSKVLVVISIRSGLVKTLMLEVGTEISRQLLEQVGRMLNERLSGLTLLEIRDTFVERIRDLQDERSGLIRLFIDSVDLLFDDVKEREKLHISGTQNIIDQPEFIDPKNFRSVIELIENDDIIVHLLEKHEELDRDFVITIGTENNEEKAKEYSIVTAMYNTEGVTGRVGIIGPTRMNYSKVIPLVDHVAKSIAKMLSS
ncbi:MAG: heat-inducible transcription repressor HrcA [Ignavibacteriales bacterium]|nr:heat-inducible transcription repressor HrcA [Ignavibacteriales bacterium]